MSSEVKENAKRAMRELFGGLTGEAIETENPEDEIVSELTKIPTEDVAVLRTPAKVESTKISADTTLTGSVKSTGALEIHGTVYGDVISEGEVYLYGRVAGNISCRNFYHYAGAVKGNVTAADHIEIESNGAILGDLKAANISSDGRVSGNITADGKVELLDNAVVAGDINTKYFTMKDSACLNGVVHMETSGRDVDNAFIDCFNF